MLENILAAQESYAKMGMDLSLERTYFLEVDGDQRDAWERQRQAPSDPSQAPLESRFEGVAMGLVRDGLAKTIEEAREMVLEEL